jgi:membrane protein
MTTREGLRPFVGAARRMFRYELTGRAAELAYYSMLALFPALIVLLAAVGLIAGQDDVKTLVDAVAHATSKGTAANARDAIAGLAERDTGAGFALGAGLVTTAYSASLYTAAFTRAGAAAHGRPTQSVPWRRRLLLMPLTVGSLLVLGVVLALLLLTGSAVEDVADVVGLRGLTSGVLSVVRWPLLVGVVLVVTYLLFLLMPGERPGWRPTVGVIAGVSAWLVASLGFAVYTATLATYESTYGTLSGVVSFLVWLWISNLALLYGVALDAELGGADPPP